MYSVPWWGQRAKRCGYFSIFLRDTLTLRKKLLNGTNSSRWFVHMFLPTLILTYLQVCSDLFFFNLSLWFFTITVEKSPIFGNVCCVCSRLMSVAVVEVVVVVGFIVIVSVGWCCRSGGRRCRCCCSPIDQLRNERSKIPLHPHTERQGNSLRHQEWCHITVFAQKSWQRWNL